MSTLLPAAQSVAMGVMAIALLRLAPVAMRAALADPLPTAVLDPRTFDYYLSMPAPVFEPGALAVYKSVWRHMEKRS